jgi:hypothetical protein
MRKVLSATTVFLAIFLCFSAAHASLTVIGTATYLGETYNLIYQDDGPNGPITWLDYSQSVNSWQTQVNWASLELGPNLTVTLNPGYTSTIDWTTGWRLPTTVDGPNVYGWDGTTTGGFNITTSEMGYLYYTELGNLGSVDTDGNTIPSGNGLTNTGPFENLVKFTYWSGTEYDTMTNDAWAFAFQSGRQEIDLKGNRFYVMAVHDGVVSAVPIPGAIWLLGPCLVGLAGLRKRFGM